MSRPRPAPKRKPTKRRKPTRKPAGTFTGQRAFARALDIAPSTLADSVQRPDWPIDVPRKSPWTAEHLEKVRAWRAGLQVDRSGKGDTSDPQTTADLHKWSAKQKEFRAQRDELLLKQTQGELIDRTRAEQALVGLTQMFTGMLQELRDGLPHKLDGDPRKNTSVVADVVDDGLRRLLGEQGVQLATLEQTADAKRRARGRPGVGGS